MQPLSAIDAISPAFTRTHETLFRPFRFGRSWKLCATSYVGFAGSVFVPFFLTLFLIPRDQLGPLQPFLFAIILCGSVAALITLYVFYLCARMELVAFEMVVSRAQFIRPMWRRNSARVWPWLWLKVAIGTVITVGSAPLLYNLLRQTIASIPPAAFGRHPNDPEALFAIFQSVIAMYAIFFGLFFMLKLIATLLHDFVMPFYILEDISLPAAIRRGFEVVIADPLAVLGYLALKPILSVVGFILQYAATIVCLIPFFIVMMVGFVVGGFIHNGAVATILLDCLAFVFFLAMTAWSGYASIGTFGYLLTLLTAYGIYFLGGRYPLLGNILDPGVGAPFTPPPVFPSDEERKDNDGGPPMPMDPAVA